jgi:hypothetical protein
MPLLFFFWGKAFDDARRLHWANADWIELQANHKPRMTARTRTSRVPNPIRNDELTSHFTCRVNWPNGPVFLGWRRCGLEIARRPWTMRPSLDRCSGICVVAGRERLFADFEDTTTRGAFRFCRKGQLGPSATFTRPVLRTTEATDVLYSSRPAEWQL